MGVHLLRFSACPAASAQFRFWFGVVVGFVGFFAGLVLLGYNEMGEGKRWKDTYHYGCTINIIPSNKPAFLHSNCFSNKEMKEQTQMLAIISIWSDTVAVGVFWKFYIIFMM